MSNIKSENTDRLFEAILTLESIEECYNFFEDICTIKEIKDLSQRFEVAELLSKGMVYSDIAKESGASSATISRVNKCLVYGNGYKHIISKVQKNAGGDK